MTETTLTPQEQSEAAEMLADLHESGYINVEEHGALKAGARIRHVGQQYPEAYRDGTGYVVSVTQRHERDFELVVVYDQPRFEGASRLTVLADYHVEVVAR